MRLQLFAVKQICFCSVKLFCNISTMYLVQTQTNSFSKEAHGSFVNLLLLIYNMPQCNAMYVSLWTHYISEEAQGSFTDWQICSVSLPRFLSPSTANDSIKFPPFEHTQIQPLRPQPSATDRTAAAEQKLKNAADFSIWLHCTNIDTANNSKVQSMHIT